MYVKIHAIMLTYQGHISIKTVGGYVNQTVFQPQIINQITPTYYLELCVSIMLKY